MSTDSHPVFESHLNSLELLHRGKVRDVYAIDDEHLLFVASDRLSAFDVVLPNPIPDKGRVLTDVSLFWFEFLAGEVRNHLADVPLTQILGADELSAVSGQALVVRRLKPLPIEAIVRGHLIGSGWKDYQHSGAVSGIRLPAGLRQADPLPETLFTPSTKAAAGEHDANIDFNQMIDLVGTQVANQVHDISIAIFEKAVTYAASKGIIIADTKFEFAVDDAGVVLIDEVLTPDSSRFWPMDQYRPGTSPPSYDKQFVRDYLESIGWNKSPPAPQLPVEIIAKTAAKYREARQRLTAC